MTREEVLNSIPLKKRFVKDNNLPITVFDNPYFIERLYTINIISDAEDKFDQFCKDMELFKNEADYFQYYNELKDKVINDIKSNKAFADFQVVPIEVITPFTNVDCVQVMTISI